MFHPEPCPLYNISNNKGTRKFNARTHNTRNVTVSGRVFCVSSSSMPLLPVDYLFLPQIRTAPYTHTWKTTTRGQTGGWPAPLLLVTSFITIHCSDEKPKLRSRARPAKNPALPHRLSINQTNWWNEWYLMSLSFIVCLPFTNLYSAGNQGPQNQPVISSLLAYNHLP